MKLYTALFAAAALLSATTGCSKADLTEGAIQVAVYRGPAATNDCSDAAKAAIERLGPRYQVHFVGPREQQDVSENTLAAYRLYVQPGGGQDIEGALRSLGNKRVVAIQQYVAHGGRYLGLCLGAYLADASHMELIPTDLDSEVSRPGFSVTTIDDSAVPVQWLGIRDYVFFQDGPYLPSAATDQAYHAIATYENGDLAAARYSYKQGVVILCGPHPEADTSWFDEAGISPAKQPRHDLFTDMLNDFQL